MIIMLMNVAVVFRQSPAHSNTNWAHCDVMYVYRLFVVIFFFLFPILIIIISGELLYILYLKAGSCYISGAAGGVKISNSLFYIQIHPNHVAAPVSYTSPSFPLFLCQSCVDILKIKLTVAIICYRLINSKSGSGRAASIFHHNWPSARRMRFFSCPVSRDRLRS